MKMTEQMVREYYQEQLAYMTWLGVSEEEYVSDHRKGRVLAAKAEFSESDDDWSDYEAHNQAMHCKYDGPSDTYEVYLEANKTKEVL